ncbi:hypothetical protein E8E12_001152 [Didymella heteroderae]|uniref:WSC domain-containing protein n=1 Tax=Didymella heteroderae TaxID=1769908 RepID=A0A9P4WSI7_9PLEO|nr:hypothetical protein E8E12_001152 [Didymella heteroderae]
MSGGLCARWCSEQGYSFAGTEWSRECFCGYDIFDPIPTEEIECSWPCSDREAVGEACGGSQRLSVYELNPDFARVPVTSPGSGSFASLGCYSDNVAGRALPVQLNVGDGGLTVERCTAACASEGFAIAGVEYGQECFCGNTLENESAPVAGEPEVSGCNILCTGDTLEFCGGANRLNLYGTLPAATPTPTLEVTPEVTPTPDPTPEVVTPSVVPEITPDAAPTPDLTPERVLEAAPTPGVTPEALAFTPEVTLEVTPAVSETTPEATPEVQPPVVDTPAVEPLDTDPSAVVEVLPAVETPAAEAPAAEITPGPTPEAPPIAESTPEPTPEVASPATETIPEATPEPTPVVSAPVAASTREPTPEVQPSSSEPAPKAKPAIPQVAPEPTPLAEIPAVETTPDTAPEIQAPAIETPVAGSTPAATAEVDTEPTPAVDELLVSSSISTLTLLVTPTPVAGGVS